MSDWQIGDLAVCVDDAPCRCGDCGGLPMLLEMGRAYRVIGFGNEGFGDFLEFSEKVGPEACLACSEFSADPERFRKIRPDEREACEPEFVTLLNRIKRKVAA